MKIEIKDMTMKVIPETEEERLIIRKRFSNNLRGYMSSDLDDCIYICFKQHGGK